MNFFNKNNAPKPLKSQKFKSPQSEKLAVSPKYKVDTINEMIKGPNDTNVNTTYFVTLEDNYKESQILKGVAKKPSDHYNDSAANLGLRRGMNNEQALQNARMLARQVASWKVARALDLRVLAKEKYALDKDDMHILGISGVVSGQSLSKEMKYHLEMLDGMDGFEKEDYLAENVFTPQIQKQLSDLQLIDAITGQTDRHHGNIYIDTVNQTIYGIDNDQSFITSANRDLINSHNTVIHWTVPTVATKESKSKKNPNFRKIDLKSDLVFTQNQVDAGSAEKILNMEESDLIELLQDNIGRTYGEFLTDEEIYSAVERLQAVKKHLKKLKKEDKLIQSWDKNTFMDSITTYGGLKTYYQDQDMSLDKNSSGKGGTGYTRYQNYIAREIYGVVHKAGEGGFKEWKIAGDPSKISRKKGVYYKEYSNFVIAKKYFSRDDIKKRARFRSKQQFDITK